MHDLINKSKIIGGIAIVFDSEPEFPAMLHDASPKDNSGELQHGCKTVYIDSNRKLIASTNKDDIVGSLIDIPESLLNIPEGDKRSTVITKDGQLIAIGISRSAGYREYKSAADDYENTVYAVCILKLGEFADGVKEHHTIDRRPRFKHNVGDIHHTVELATFRIGTDWFGLRTSDILEAVTPEQILSLPNSAPSVAGCFMYQEEGVPLLNMRSKLTFNGATPPLNKLIVIVMRMPDGKRLSLQVDALGDIVKLHSDRLVDDHQATAFSIARSIVPSDEFDGDDQEGRSMMQVLDAPGILSAAGLQVSTNQAA